MICINDRTKLCDKDTSTNDIIDELMKNIKESVKADGNGGLAAGLTKALCCMSLIFGWCVDANRSDDYDEIQILVLQASSDNTKEYVPLMNCFSQCANMKIPIDGLFIGGDSAFLQVGANMTNGLYFNTYTIEEIYTTLTVWNYIG